MRLFLIRHSIAQDDASSDFERSLTTEGKNLIIKVTTNLPIKPAPDSVFYSSPANRAIETAKVFASFFGLKENIKTDEFLYRYHSPERFLMWLDTIGEVNDLWVFGHNPMLSQIVTFFTNDQIYSMPKCAVAGFESNARSWFEVNHKTSKLLFFESPKKYK